MKLITILSLALSSIVSQAQISITVNSGNETIGDGGSHPVLKVSIYDSNEKDIVKAWRQLMKKNNAKTSSKKEVFADNAMIKGFGNNPCDLYAKVNKIEDRKSELVVAVDLGGAYLSESQHADKHAIMKTLLHEFGVKTTKDAIDGQVKAAQKVLKKLEKERDNLIKKNDGLQKDIKDYEAKIVKAKSGIEQNEKDQITKKAEVVHQIAEVDAIKQKEAAVK